MSEPSLTACAEVVVFLPIAKSFHYQIPPQPSSPVAVGKRVVVPFGRRHVVGMVVGISHEAPVKDLKPILDVLDLDPIVDGELLELTRWLGNTYGSGWGEAIATALPGPLRRGKGLVVRSRTKEEEIPWVPTPVPSLNEEQRKVLEAMAPFLSPPRHRVFLLHGVTGSGKTEVYLKAIEQVLACGRSCLVLVPEISLTPQTIQRFQGRLGQQTVAVLHSGMLDSHRMKQWIRIRSGEASLVIGARSAIFAPLKALGLIVVDEEHEPSYKQEDAPRYHTREVAIRRAELADAVVILGSATPSLETYARATLPSQADRPIHLLELTQRVEQTPLPEVEIVDMRQELTWGKRHRIFSRKLEEALAQIGEQRQQAILFLNRRGFSTFVHCPRCGWVLKCEGCGLPYTYHLSNAMLLCHHCHTTAVSPELCPRCQSQYIRFRGIGTERVENELGRLFPQLRVARMDRDVTRFRGAHLKVLEAFRRHEVDVLVGTQMIAKGLDFPRVTLVGVISADTALNLPDFRSAERTFQLLTQVAGRAGRGSLPGRVIIQTYTPDHYAIQAAKTHDYLGFFRHEIEMRRQLRLPPFVRLIILLVRGYRSATALEFAKRLSDACRDLGKTIPLDVFGPALAPIPRLRRQYRFQILLKLPSGNPVPADLLHLIERQRPPHGCYLAMDVDPL
jgi:primosomal protein N' (replication factor Y)